MTTELLAPQILSDPNPAQENFNVTQENSSPSDNSSSISLPPDVEALGTRETPVPFPRLVKSRSTGDYIHHKHDQSRNRFLSDVARPLATRALNLQDDYGLDELRAPPILPEYEERRKSLEVSLSRRPGPTGKHWTTRLRHDFVVGSWISCLALWGALARIGLQALSTYPGQPVFALIWPQFVGCVAMGFLLQDKALFPKEEGYMALYIGLSTGFCGSLTSFSSFVYDCFLALANLDPYYERPRGRNVLALIAQVIMTLCVAVAGLRFGAHIAQVMRHLLPSSAPLTKHSRLLDVLGVFLGVGTWTAAGIMTGLIPSLRYQLFTASFAPLGTLPPKDCY
jgi:fluoride ion exporter CrcB/FEX